MKGGATEGSIQAGRPRGAITETKNALSYRDTSTTADNRTVSKAM